MSEPSLLGRRGREVGVVLLLAAASLAVYAHVCENEFVNFDDNKYVFENTYLLAGLTDSGVIWSFTSTYASNWHPLTWLSLLLDFELYELEPWGYHLTNVLLHVANVVLVY